MTYYLSINMMILPSLHKPIQPLETRDQRHQRRAVSFPVFSQSEYTQKHHNHGARRPIPPSAGVRKRSICLELLKLTSSTQ